MYKHYRLGVSLPDHMPSPLPPSSLRCCTGLIFETVKRYELAQPLAVRSPRVSVDYSREELATDRVEHASILHQRDPSQVFFHVPKIQIPDCGASKVHWLQQP